jgi:hypothetical protein
MVHIQPMANFRMAMLTVERPQDAMAFIAAKYMVNDLYCKEFPLEAVTWKEWQNELMDLDEGYRAFLVENAIPVSPLQT